ncbi:HD domain-containing phosphohydrolase [Halanaerobium hydrogeniformans]|uniref:Diguanylate cyclase and metal dependent phosphohydrolase n=1 Tax=Halanaerobium hydrogeniformans TaxID=656519 RepID=E4RKW6_HALHG|nr:HD domain-containing phosphohydrolase [Halanaerobium hydrogeniformans]ADQ15707.1 diguanylate cyclase and metal dependent phosphohydrolase [Halanaerobium hydrogeniformans]
MKKFLLVLVLILIVTFSAGAETPEVRDNVINIFDGHGSPMLFIDQESGEIIYANDAAAEFYGYSKEELTEINIAEINVLSPEETAEEMAAAVREERNFFQFEHRLESGEIRHVEVYSYPQMFEGREILLSIIHDVTPRVELAERNRQISNYFYITLIIIILILFIASFLYYKNYQAAKKRNKEIERLNKLRQTFIDADDSLVYLKDQNLNYVFVNDRVAEFYGKDKDEIIGIDDYQLSEPGFAEFVRKTDNRVKEKGELISQEVRWQNKVYNSTKFPVKLLDGTYGVGAYIRDITEEYKNRQKLSIERNKYLQTLLSIGDAVMIVNNQRQVEMINEVAEELTGWNKTEAEGRDYRSVLNLSSADEEKDLVNPVELAFETEETQELEDGAILVAKDDSKYFIDDTAAPIKDENDQVRGVVVVFRDETASREQKEKIEYLSYHDPMTGLYNRRFFEEELKRLNVDRNLPMSIIIGDLNGLKLTNDIFGHNAGDKLLFKATEAFKESCREDDIIARWGGDEFIILLPQTSRKDAEKVVRRIKESFSKKNSTALSSGIAMGVSTKIASEEDIIKLIDEAETEMYSSKTVSRTDNDIKHIENITNILDEKSSREEKHANRTAELAARLANKLDLKESECKKITNAALYHDIGKVAVDEEILNKKSALTPKEYDEIKLHALTSYRILNYFSDTIDIAQCVLAHHERWDGTGYPKGLKEKEIPLAARIVAIAEAYEVMTSADTYKKKNISKEEAVAELKRCAGSQFDPELVKKFIEVLNEN